MNIFEQWFCDDRSVVTSLLVVQTAGNLGL
jgi:hypothetical protein